MNHLQKGKMDKKQNIITSFLELVKETGSMKNISVQNIADKAEIGKGTVYEYFDNKEEIIKEAFKYMIEVMTKTFLVTDNYQGLNFVERLHKYIDNTVNASMIVSQYSKYNHHNIGEIANYIDIKELLKERIKQFQRDSVRLFKDNVISVGIEEGVIKRDISDLHVHLLVKMVTRELTENMEFEFFNNDELGKSLFDITYAILSNE